MEESAGSFEEAGRRSGLWKRSIALISVPAFMCGLRQVTPFPSLSVSAVKYR